MVKLSAGILLYTLRNSGVEVLLVHPGGPFWARKDVGSWSVPKGEYVLGEDVFGAALREFKEETGSEVSPDDPLELGDVQYSNKKVTIWALKGELDPSKITSTTFTAEWPPKSGKQQVFPEVDRAAWFSPHVARQKLIKGQQELIDRLLEKLDVSMPVCTPDSSSGQLELF